uniref:Cytohesin Ubiquitin Protein Inducing domain-containing protein n=1 Tax=Meloidogyne enterolobii TaxID=390850 RepID=A0A6V7VIE7_MELEN|nr:unnamed protein product [Meloidogyne enterolobii]
MKKVGISNALRIQAELLEETLIKRLEELKRICIEEAELTGQLPKEIYKTLLPGEPEPIIKRRVGTTFKFPQKLLNDNNQIDELGRLETEIVLNKRIVAAAERLATDWSANKGLRKKRRRDLQMATIKLRTLEKDLNRRICLSNSKPDVSTPLRKKFKECADKNWPNFYNTIKWGNPSTKSCPSTPHGSVLDLAEVAPNISPQKKNRKDSKKSRKTPTNAKNLHNLIKKEEQQKLLNSQQIPKQQNQKIKNCCSSPTTKLPLSFSTSASSSSTSSYSSSLSLNGPTPSIKGQKINGGTVSATISSSSGISASMSASLASASSTNLITPPPIPCRRSSAGSNNKNNKSSPPTLKETSNFYIKTELKEEITTNNSTHLYANIGYTSSAPYKSAYRQSNFPTLQNTQKSLSPTNNYCYNNCYSVPSTSILNNKEFPSSKQHLNTLINSSSISSSALPRFNKISPQQSLLIPSYYSSSSLDRRALKGKKNQTENKQSPQLRLQQKPPPFYSCHLNESFVKQFSLQRKNVATTFPVDTKLNPFESTDSPNSPQNTFNFK